MSQDYGQRLDTYDPRSVREVVQSSQRVDGQDIPVLETQDHGSIVLSQVLQMLTNKDTVRATGSAKAQRDESGLAGPNSLPDYLTVRFADRS